jgi:hypothetical protein
MVRDLFFSYSDERVVFAVIADGQTCFYSKNLSLDTATTLLLTLPWSVHGFGAADNDSIYADSAAVGHLSMNPSSDKWVVFAEQGDFYDRFWMVRNRRTRRLHVFGQGSSRPYSTGFVDWPRWMPGGQDLLFSAAPASHGGKYFDPTELWLLKDALSDTLPE